MLSDFQKKKLTHLFNFWDADNNGYLERTDYEAIVKRICAERGWGAGTPRYAATHNAVLATWGEARLFADADKDERITLDEWLAYYDHVITDPAAYRINVNGLMTTLLGAIDTDNDGHITPDDFAMWFRIYNADEDDARQSFALIDTDGNGKLSIEELIIAVDTFFLGDDPAALGNALFGTISG